MSEPGRASIAALLSRSQPARAAMLVGLLLIPTLIISLQLYAGYRLNGMKVAFAGVFLLQFVHWEWWAVVGPLVWRLERRWPLTGAHRARSLRRHAATAPLVAAAVLTLNLAAFHTLLRVPGVSDWFRGMDQELWATITFFFAAYFHVELLIYAGIIAVAYAVRTTALLRRTEEDALRLEAELTGAKLATLRTQLQPHFLFNTLHTIGSLVLQRKNPQAVELLAELGELLRGTLAHRDTDLAPLGDEIASLQRYLRIEEARFGDRLRVEWNIDPAAHDALIPPFLLQPLIENAFRHGISQRADESLLNIGARIDNASLRIVIYNDGPALAPSFSLDASTGYGLQNVRERLQTRSPAGRIELVNDGAGVRATLVLPLWEASTVRSAS